MSYPASSNRRWQHGQRSSPLSISERNALGCGKVMIALNANGARWA
jgi:hypothetical protein